jgi:hypothetical protein
MSLPYLNESPVTGQVEDEDEYCPECGEELDEYGDCPNGCLDDELIIEDDERSSGW